MVCPRKSGSKPQQRDEKMGGATHHRRVCEQVADSLQFRGENSLASMIPADASSSVLLIAQVDLHLVAVSRPSVWTPRRLSPPPILVLNLQTACKVTAIETGAMYTTGSRLLKRRQPEACASVSNKTPSEPTTAPPKTAHHSVTPREMSSPAVLSLRLAVEACPSSAAIAPRASERSSMPSPNGR
eukprot:3864694-Rhodomonas_salina.2